MGGESLWPAPGLLQRTTNVSDPKVTAQINSGKTAFNGAKTSCHRRGLRGAHTSTSWFQALHTHDTAILCWRLFGGAEVTPAAKAYLSLLQPCSRVQGSRRHSPTPSK
jgi:hypothetical protein